MHDLGVSQLWNTRHLFPHGFLLLIIGCSALPTFRPQITEWEQQSGSVSNQLTFQYTLCDANLPFQVHPFRMLHHSVFAFRAFSHCNTGQSENDCLLPVTQVTLVTTFGNCDLYLWRLAEDDVRPDGLPSTDSAFMHSTSDKRNTEVITVVQDLSVRQYVVGVVNADRQYPFL